MTTREERLEQMGLTQRNADGDRLDMSDAYVRLRDHGRRVQVRGEHRFEGRVWRVVKAAFWPVVVAGAFFVAGWMSRGAQF